MLNLLIKFDKHLFRISLNILAIVKGFLICNKFMTTSINKGFKDHRSKVVVGDVQYMTIFERLTDSYKKAKADQINVDLPYRVGPMWQNIVNKDFENLSDCLRIKDVAKLKTILENFHREPCSSSAGGGFGDYHMMKKNPFLYKYLFAYTWYKYYNTYKEVTGDNLELSFPLVGNPVGLYHGGQIIPSEAIRYHYYAREILSLLRDVDHPVVCEIGCGVGGLAHAITSNSGRDITYILLDIPETLVISSYFLMAALPEKKFMLYGEGLLDSGNLDQYDIILMPNFMLPQLADEKVDLFFNSNSFSEIDSVTVEEYIRQIERICRKYFMHINHTAKFVWYDDDGEKVVNMCGTEIRPDPARFKKIYQHPRVFASVKDEAFYYKL